MLLSWRGRRNDAFARSGVQHNLRAEVKNWHPRTQIGPLNAKAASRENGAPKRRDFVSIAGA